MAKVKYLCTCKRFLPFAELYFCRHCIKLKCANCAIYEIDSYYCPHCLENVPSTEAKIKDNRCSNCYQCPLCFNPLYSKNIKQNKGGGENNDYLPSLMCEVCMWNNKSEHSKNLLPIDIPSESQGLSKKNTKSDINIQELITCYQNINNFSYFSFKGRFPKSKYLIDNMQMKNIMGFNPSDLISCSNEDFEDGFNDMEKELFSENNETISINTRSSLSQRLNNSGQQPGDAHDLSPSNVHFSVRLVLRCNDCEHYIIKPELKPGTVHFKIDQMAMYSVPEVTVIHPPISLTPVTLTEPDNGSFVVSQDDCVIVLVKNLSAYPRNVTLYPFQEGQILDEIRAKLDPTDFSGDGDPLQKLLDNLLKVHVPHIDSDGLVLDKMPNDIETLGGFQQLNLNLAHQVKKRALPNNTVIYHELNRVALRFRVGVDPEVMKDDKQVEGTVPTEDKAAGDGASKIHNLPLCEKTTRCYLILSHNYSNPTLFVSSSGSTVASSLTSAIKDRAINALGNLMVSAAIATDLKDPKEVPDKPPEVIMKHIVQIEF